jgi:hypothetical protein
MLKKINMESGIIMDFTAFCSLRYATVSIQDAIYKLGECGKEQKHNFAEWAKYKEALTMMSHMDCVVGKQSV